MKQHLVEKKDCDLCNLKDSEEHTSAQCEGICERLEQLQYKEDFALTDRSQA